MPIEFRCTVCHKLLRIGDDVAKIVAIVAAAAVAAAVLFAWDPAQSDFFPLCLFHALTGLHCPGCGTSRALHQLLHGNLSAALALNPLMMVLLPAVIVSLLVRSLRKAAGRTVCRRVVSPVWIWALLVVVVLFWILRNVPVHPFTMLAP